ncbi:MAG TPA: hypothetical protein VJH22_03400 [Candidatus Nanoarchaeia archaeon]|nr:hypothetical protein [Candidatus Nanoarchaeia archaeon]
MGRITAAIEPQVEALFRKMAWKSFGRKRGALSQAANEALARWTESHLKGNL